jgi:hypothetical protein
VPPCSRFLAAAFLTLALAGCDASDPEPEPDPDPANFSFASLSGGVGGSFAGRAYFTVVGDQFRLYLFVGPERSLDTDSTEFVAFFSLSGLPRPGEYDVRLPGHPEARMYAGYSRTTPNRLEVAGEHGVITIRSASADAVSGGFSFSGTAYAPGQRGRGAVSGGFQATPSTAPLPAYPFVFPED